MPDETVHPENRLQRDAPHRRWWEPLVLVLLVLAQQVPASLSDSATFDETYHVSAGYKLLRGGELWWTPPQHTPLLPQVVALPLLLLNPQVPEGVDNRGTLAHRFFFDNVVDADKMLFTSRLATSALSALLVCAVYAWGSELWGRRGGLLAGFVAALDPNLIAHGRLATTDAGTACFLFLAVYGFWRFLRHPGPLRLLAAGAATGLALGARFPGAIVVPLLAILGFCHLAGLTDAERGRRHLWLWLLLIGLIAAAVLVASYRGEFRPFWKMAAEVQALEEGSLAPPNAGPAVDFALTRLPIPVPSYWYGLWQVQQDVAGGRPAFLWGQRAETGWWYYFPLAILIKTPLPTLILVGCALVGRPGAWRGRWRELLFLLLPAVLWVGPAMASRMSLGYRYVLPMWPFLFVLCGRVARRLDGWRKPAALALLGWLAVTAVTIFPHHLAYFNELVGGPEEGYRYLVDSNLDWGQDLKRLARYQAEHAVGKIHLAYFGTADPDYYGLDYECLPSLGLLACPDTPIPRSGTLAVSVTCLQGWCSRDPAAYLWLLDEEPVAKIGCSIYVYELPRK